MTDTPRTDCVGRITAYLTHGGLWNPELAIHEAVRQLFMDCREELITAERELAEARKDAERYRWLRSECGRYIDWDELESIDGDISEVGFDAAIDAARREHGQG